MLKSLAAVLAAVQLGVALPAAAQPLSPPAAVSTPFDVAARGAAVQAAAKALRDRYVYPEVGARAAAMLEANLAAGAYDGLTDRVAFADRLTADLADIAHDKHMRVTADGSPPPPGVAMMGPRPRSEFGVVRADRLAGGAGYLEVVGFPPLEAFRQSVDRAMAALAGSSAIIVDLRRNGGGNPASVAYLASYFFDGAKPVHLNDLIWRNAGTNTFRTETFYTAPTPASFAKAPVYLLTSASTFSGGEEFLYDLQTQKRAVLVGEVTGGGANPGGVQPLGPGLRVFMPAGRAENPITRTSWEGRGVTPDVAVPRADALRVALQKLGQSPAAGDIETLSKARVFAPHTSPSPAADAAARRLVDEAATQKFRYDLMSSQAAEAVRNHAPTLASQFSGWGAVQSVTFREVGPEGADVYDVKLANGAARLILILAADGKVLLVDLRPA